MADFLTIADQIELLGGGVASTNPLCPGAVFRLGTGYDLGAPQPSVDFLVQLMLDGQLPVGTSTGNRTPSLPIVIQAPDRFTLAAARELLLKTINSPTWTMTWTRDPGSGTAMPMVLDCYRAGPSVPTWSIIKDHNLGAEIQINFQAAPFGRSDTPVTIPVASPMPGFTAPPAPVVLDTFSAVSSSNFVTSTRAVIDAASARWNPSLSPLSDATGAGSQPGAKYTKTGLSANITDLPAFTFYAGFGTDYWATWHRGPVVFAVTLTDNGAHVIKFGSTRTVSAGASVTAPVWKQVALAIPQGVAGFNYANVTGYTITVSNRGYNTLRFTQLYLSHVVANPPSVQNVLAAVRGQMYYLPAVKGTARTTAAFSFAEVVGTGTPTTVTLPGPAGSVQQWQAPLGVTSVAVNVVAPGGKGGNINNGTDGGGGGSGEQAAEPAVAVTALGLYSYNLGAPGGPDAFFTGNSVTVLAHRGTNAVNNAVTPGAAGVGSTNTSHHNGAAGVAGVNGTATPGGGGSSGGTSAAGNVGSGRIGGAAVTGGGFGGNGGLTTSSPTPGHDGGYPGGGGGGAHGGAGSFNPGGAGGAGQIQLTYTPLTNAFSTLLVHSPPDTAPDSLTPYLVINATDVPDGSTEYPLVSATPGQNARFDGTYTVMLAAASFATPTVARNLTVTINQYEFVGGPVYATTVVRNGVIPSNDVAGAGYTGVSGLNGVVVVGDCTLPTKDVAPDNTSAYYTATITSSNTADRIADVAFLDSMGQTLLVNVPVTNAYATYWLDTPEVDKPLGRILASAFDRSSAVSVSDYCPVISGGPVFLTPGDNYVLVWSPAGAPALTCTYFDQYWLDRIS